MPQINPTILLWARETAGISETEAVSRLGIRDTRAISALQKLSEFEAGERHPSRALLVKMSKAYRRPLLVFYLSSPPQKGVRGHDFRTLPLGYTIGDEVLVDTLIREVRARQDIVREALDTLDENEPLPFIGSIQISDGLSAGLQSLSNLLGIDRSQLQAATSPEDVFKKLRQCASDAGVYVILQGDLGSHHSAISAETFRGFALADKIAPFVVINDHDSTTAWSFTLLHELVHLCLGATGISGGRVDTVLERFCNDVASAFLLDDTEVSRLQINDATDPGRARELINDFARLHRISRSMVVYRLFRLGAISHEYWQPLHDYFRAQWLNSRVLRRERARVSDGGPDYYVVRRHRVGDALIRVVRRMMAGGALTTTKAGKVLSVKPQNVGILLGSSAAPSGRAA